MLVVLLGLTLAIRLWGIHDRLPDASLHINVLDDSVIEETDRTTMGRAWLLWRGGTRAFDPNPHTGGWPALSFYLTLGLQYLFKIHYMSVSSGATAAQFQEYVAHEGAAPMFLFARIVGALIGTLTVYLTYRIASRLAGRTVGLLAGLLLATNTLHVLTSQHVSDPNLLALLFVLLATPPLLRVVEGGTWRDSVQAGAMIGLAGACKYVPLILALPLALAQIGRRAGAVAAGTRPKLARAGLTGWLERHPLSAGLLAMGAALFVATPYLFLDWKRTVIDIVGQKKALFSDWVGQTVFPISLPTYLAVTLPHAMGWPAYLLGLLGMVLLWRQGKVARTLVWIPIMMVVANGMLKSAQDRYILVALPFLHIAAAYALLRGASWVAARVPTLKPGSLPGRLAPALLAAAAVAWPLPELVATRQAWSLPDSRHLVRHWISDHLGANTPIGVELYGPVFALNERAMIIWPFFATQSQLARPAYHPEFLDGLEYHVASGEISRRFEAEPEKYPVENAYYRWLGRHATVVWQSDSTMAGPHIVVRRLPSNISTRAQRDSVFAQAMPEPNGVNRLELWCLDYSKMCQWVKEYPRMEEWARRGLLVGVTEMEAPVRSQLAISLWRQGKNDSADVEMRAAIRLMPKNSAATYRLYHASILSDLGRVPEAITELHIAYEESGHDPRIHVPMGQALARLGRFDDAVQELLQVPQNHPQRGLALRDAGILILDHSNRPIEALEYFRESIQLDPNQEQADLVRAQIARLEAMKGKP
ncbi:MAG TPA: tetratricopeptide repeat protein [Candidatus Binatia bacterium]|nr:tetratricopeptide repeat protein [Candidatus Binatia bacterium]